MQPQEYIQLLSQQFTPNTTPSSAQHTLTLTLTLNPHHLYYLLIRFEQLTLADTPLDSPAAAPYHPIHWSSSPAAASHPADRSDATSLFSNLSITTTTSSLWNYPLLSTLRNTPKLHLFGANNHPSTPQEQLRLLYSTFTKLPSLCLTPSSTPSNAFQRVVPTKPEPMQLIHGFLDLPNQRLVPLNCFKSLWSLYLLELDPRIFSGWLQLSQNLRKLEMRRSGLEDLEDFLVDAILDEIKRDQKREADRIHVAAEQQQTTPPPTNTNTNTNPTAPSIQYHPSSDSLPPEFPTLSWAFLQHLCLADNAFTFLPTKPLRALSSLVSLDLSSNLLIAVPTGLQTLPRLRLLNLSDNMIDSVLGIYHLLPNITTINLSHNRLTSLCGVENLMSLERMDVRGNEIQDQGEISRLATLPKLTSLWTSGNPFCSLNPGWRTQVFNYFVLENRAIDQGVATTTTSETPTVNLKLDNQGPTNAERKALNKPPSSPSTIDPSCQPLLQATRTTLVKSPESSNKRSRHPLSHNHSKKGRRKLARIIDLDHDAGPHLVLHPNSQPRPSAPREVSSDPSHLSFRNRVEALRLELGDDSWLTVLSESDFPLPSS